MKIQKIDLEKIDKLEENPDKVKKIVENWALKSLNDPKLHWEDAMQNAAKELGLNKAEFVTLIFGNEPFDDLAYYIDISKTIREGRF